MHREEINPNKILLKPQIYLQLAGTGVSPLMFPVKVKEDTLIKRWGGGRKIGDKWKLIRHLREVISGISKRSNPTEC